MEGSLEKSLKIKTALKGSGNHSEALKNVEEQKKSADLGDNCIQNFH